MIKTKALTWPERIAHYEKITKFPKALFVAGGGGCVVGTFIMGNSYQVQSKFYGGYPAGYLKRMKALFPDKQKVLHLFSGMVDTKIFPGDTVDINAENNPTYVDDAQRLKKVPLSKYDLVMADPPYSIEDAVHYQTTMIKRNVVMDALGQRLKKGTNVIWLDQVLPMYRKADFKIVALIGMCKSTNHRFRLITIFEKV